MTNKEFKKNLREILRELELDRLPKQKDKLITLIENLRHDFYLFQTYVSQYKEILEDSNLFENKTRQQEVRELTELYRNIVTVGTRIKNNIKHLENILNTRPKITKDFVENTNQSFLDMLNNYEITVARYSKLLFEFKISPAPEKLKTPMKEMIESTNNLNSIILDFNSNYDHKLIVPFEDSEIANTIHSYGFNIVSEKNWSQLVKYRD